MSLKEVLLNDLKNAMKNKDTILKDTIQLVRAGILQIEKDNKIQLDDEGVIDVIVKEIKKSNDVLPDFQKSGRQDLIDDLYKKLDILKSYLPDQLTTDEIKQIVLDSINSVNASSIKDMGKVMSIVTEKTKGRADNKIVSQIVKDFLQNL